MKVQIFSDLHLDVGRVKPISVAKDVDIVIVPGDVCEGAIAAFQALRRIVQTHVPIVMVLGNHEFYRSFISEELEEAKARAGHFNITLLADSTAIINGVRFVGCTLWTDYRIFGDANQAAVMATCARGMNDHRLIGWQKRPWLRFRPQEAAFLHNRSRTFLRETLSNRFDGPSVVVSHHGAHWNSVHPAFREDPLTAAFVSDLSAEIETYRPSMWVHGHVHCSFDYRIGRDFTRVVCNAHGYGDENPNFDSNFIVDIDTGVHS